MEIGDYYRTKKGLISVVKTMNTPETRKEKHMGYVKRNVHLINGRHTLDDIVSHSSDIKELVQAGDYVNGKEVYLEKGELAVELAEHMPPYALLKDIEIKNIVTKEQFASLEFTV